MKETEFFRSRYYGARFAIINKSERKAVSAFGLSRDQIRYWKKKIVNANFRNGTWGGNRRSKYNVDQKIVLTFLLRYLVDKLPTLSLRQYQIQLAHAGFELSRPTICRIIRDFGYSRKVAEYKQRQKFTSENVSRMLHHVLLMPDLLRLYGIDRIKFLDEVHFVTKGMDRQYGYSVKGKPVIVVRDTNLKESFIFFIMSFEGPTVCRKHSTGFEHTIRLCQVCGRLY